MGSDAGTSECDFGARNAAPTDDAVPLAVASRDGKSHRANWSSRASASFKSIVSKPSVNQL
jgi:hypothetical protein